MTHGPCGKDFPKAVCMDKGKCTKHFPKHFSEFTVVNDEGYPAYARPNNGRKYKRKNSRNNFEYDNRYVVPYSPALLWKYRCHINVELTFSNKSLKYMHKYIYKGHDVTTMEFGTAQDEVQQYLNARYVSAHEAIWRLSANTLHVQVPSVTDLGVHLPGENSVIFNPDQPPEDILVRASESRTKLMAYFEANAKDLIGMGGRRARDTFYMDFPEFFTFDANKKCWKPRKSGFSIGRMHFVHIASGERFHLRTLLTVVKGATSFGELKTYEGITYDKFQEACVARGLLESDQQWHMCLSEVATKQSGYELRRLFAIILLMSSPSDPKALWDAFKAHICDDLKNIVRDKHRDKYQGDDPSDDVIYDFGLYDLQKVLNHSGKLLSEVGMPSPNISWEVGVVDLLTREQNAYDIAKEKESADTNIALLNHEQKMAFNEIMKAVDEQQPKMFFVNGPGGTGKSFVWNTLAHACRAKGYIVLCVASSGIASILLKGGRTSHNMFQIPVPCDKDSSCSTKKKSQKARLIRNARLIVWDEVPMQSRFTCEAVDRSLRDLFGKDNVPFGGVPVAWGGDFQQILPVIPRGSKEQIIGECLQKSNLWKFVKIFILKKNMHVDPYDPSSVHFAQWLLDIGHGKDLPLDHSIEIPSHMICGPEIHHLIEEIYPFIDEYEDQNN